MLPVLALLAVAGSSSTTGLSGGGPDEGQLTFLGSSLWTKAHDVEVRDGRAYCAFLDGLQILDLSDPKKPQALSSLHLGGGFAVSLAGNLALVAAADKGLAVIDVSDPKAPVLKSLLDTPGQARDVAVDGSVALVADGTGGVLAVDIARPAAPKLLGAWDSPGEATGLALKGKIPLRRRRQRRPRDRRRLGAGQAQARRGPRHGRHGRGGRTGGGLCLYRRRSRRPQGRGRVRPGRAEAGRLPGRVGLRPERLGEREAAWRRQPLRRRLPGPGHHEPGRSSRPLDQQVHHVQRGLAGRPRRRRRRRYRLLFRDLLRGRRRRGQTQGHVPLPRARAPIVAVCGRDRHAYAVGELSGVMAVDVGDPARPALVGGTSIFRGVQGIAASGNFVYVTDRWSIKAFDVTDPAKPEDGEGPDLHGRHPQDPGRPGQRRVSHGR